MRKIIKQWGDSAVIVLPVDDMKVYGLKVGDVIEIEINKIEVENGDIQKD